MSESILEAVARAIWRETYRHDTLMEWHAIKKGTMHHKRVVAAAHAAIAAMRQPTVDMCAAGLDPRIGGIAPMWRAMIDAALSPAPLPTPADRAGQEKRS